MGNKRVSEGWRACRQLEERLTIPVHRHPDDGRSMVLGRLYDSVAIFPSVSREFKS